MRQALLSARVVPRPSSRRELLQALVAWVGSVRQEPGALAASVYEDVEDPAAFRVESEWADVPALEQHLRSHSFGALLGAFELLAQPPRLVVSATLEPYAGDPAGAIRTLREGRGRPLEQ
jgi:quinol monooxygenase YgiN